MKLSVSALITNFNTWPLTQKCISELIYLSDGSLSEIVVVDDASDEAEPFFLPKKVHVIQNSQNKGYVASVNIGFSQIKEDIVVLLDSDAYPLVDLAQHLLTIFDANSRLGAVGFHLVDEEGNPTGSHRPEPHSLGLLLGQKLEARTRPLLPLLQNRPICLHSCGMAVRRTAFEDVGGFDEGFDFLDADTDFSMRLRRAGWQIRYQPELLAFHKGGGSFQTTATRVFRYHKNRWRLLDKHGCLPPSTIFKAALAIRHTLEYCILKVTGEQLFKDPISFQDKLDGRQKLLQEVWSGYGNQK
jgi:GT2 family glycosyltransferase